MNEWLNNILGTNSYTLPDYAKKLQIALSPQNTGLLIQGNIDLNNRPVVKNPETGGKSTVWSMGIGLDNGRQALIPRISNEGNVLSEKEAIDLFRKTKRHLGIFDSIDAANNYAKKLHEEQEMKYLNKE